MISQSGVEMTISKWKKLYHGTSAPDFERFATYQYFTDNPKEAEGFAKGIHLGGKTGGIPRIIEVEYPMMKIKDIDRLITDGIMVKGLTDDEVISREIKGAIKEGFDTLRFTHPANYEEDFYVYVPLFTSKIRMIKVIKL